MIGNDKNVMYCSKVWLATKNTAGVHTKGGISLGKQKKLCIFCWIDLLDLFYDIRIVYIYFDFHSWQEKSQNMR